jgi:hypothetical protein
MELRGLRLIFTKGMLLVTLVILLVTLATLATVETHFTTIDSFAIIIALDTSLVEFPIVLFPVTIPRFFARFARFGENTPKHCKHHEQTNRTNYQSQTFHDFFKVVTRIELHTTMRYLFPQQTNRSRMFKYRDEKSAKKTLFELFKIIETVVANKARQCLSNSFGFLPCV